MRQRTRTDKRGAWRGIRPVLMKTSSPSFRRKPESITNEEVGT
jgi:hypothetical protein